ncbi:MAG: hypothetical protein AB7N76_14790 [Planctomycetota bacterium]
MLRAAAHLLVLFALVAQLPLLGAWLLGYPLEGYREVLPRLGRVRHAPFAWPAFLGLALLILLCVAPLVRRFLRGAPDDSPSATQAEPALPEPGRFPWWGWAGLALGALSWVVAWTPWPALAPLREHTFTPLWVAYITVANALVARRRGRCLFAEPRAWALVPLSAVFWWFFEYLNRFVENWDYHGPEFQDGWDLLLHGTLPFATVLPAVASTQDLLATYPRLTAPFRDAWRWRCPWPRAAALLVLLLASAGLAGLAWAPNALFPLPWFAPLFILLALQVLAGERPPLLRDVAAGDWRAPVTFALAALICGAFWEMWNSLSLARWTYRVPYVQAFHIFEMPLLGYAGYPPFGLECAAVSALVGFQGRRWFAP